MAVLTIISEVKKIHPKEIALVKRVVDFCLLPFYKTRSGVIGSD